MYLDPTLNVQLTSGIPWPTIVGSHMRFGISSYVQDHSAPNSLARSRPLVSMSIVSESRRYVNRIAGPYFRSIRTQN